MIRLGIFDSGIGGLTVFREVRDALPGADILYFGDTARVPYGTKSAETVTRYSLQIAWYLIGRGVDAVVVACNTSSAYAIDVLREVLDVPVFGVVDPGARAAVEVTKTGKIGVIGTRGTISSGAYQKAIARLSGDTRVIASACPLFVPLVEEGWLTDPVTRDVASRYLVPQLKGGVDTLVLGCTHYPLLKEAIGEIMGEDVRLIDSARETAREVKAFVEEKGLRDEKTPGKERFEVTDSPARFSEVGKIFLRHELGNIHQVNIVEGE